MVWQIPRRTTEPRRLLDLAWPRAARRCGGLWRGSRIPFYDLVELPTISSNDPRHWGSSRSRCPNARLSESFNRWDKPLSGAVVRETSPALSAQILDWKRFLQSNGQRLPAGMRHPRLKLCDSSTRGLPESTTSSHPWSSRARNPSCVSMDPAWKSEQHVQQYGRNHAGAAEPEDILIRIGNAQDVLARARDSLSGLSRLLSYLAFALPNMTPAKALT